MTTANPVEAASALAGENRLLRFAAGAMVFLGAFLAFSLEPIVGRLVTPFFGGAVHVWTVSLMVFQALLLLGYLYAHLLAPRIGAWHLLLLFLPLLQWPLGFVSEVAPKAPIVTLVAALLVHVSLPFAVLSTSAVVAQSWWYGASSNPGRSPPFFLYGISNLGAMAALFSYPFLVEPLFGVTVQRWAWSLGYLFYMGVTAWAWMLLKPRCEAGRTDEDAVSRPGKLVVLHWLALSAGPSALLLAATNVIAMEVGSFPMVWVLPLALYLGSFIVAFRDRQGAIVSRLHFWLIEMALLALLAARFAGFGIWALPLILLGFYALCVIANERLYGLRPHPVQLTGFYLTIAVGGWIGGLLVSLVAPLLFTGLLEYPLSVLVVVFASWQPGMLAWWQATTLLKGGGRLALLMLGCTALGMSFWYAPEVYSLRNFYGLSRIIDRQSQEGAPYRMLVHGATLHGLQYLNPERHHEPLGYYYAGGALEQAVSVRHRPARVAMVGLGAGGATPWFGAGEDIAIFEIDPDMELLARRWFSYLENTPAQVRIQVGDARLNLGREALKGHRPYDVVFIDAFSGDGVPTHLLTLEALDVYLSRLAEDGVLVFHVSNRYYDLRPILKAAAKARGLAAAATLQPGKDAGRLNIDPWVVVLARQPDRLAPLSADGKWTVLGELDGLPDVDVWTDDYVNILAPLWVKWSKHESI
ncbi:hypothetical protein SAMN05660284_00788 [Formivibrio citricus]|uniref:Spermidine synthase n=1 Tax=Formivibrio citricus TaxID=83765 RepID=A0A1I4WYR7_9NEIS|nr:fused MFS/spermidine synthase [Formivibrio citricus]SFN18363.1 hypothetical protein SAMN05660284_00788 [Formivibrio citricus]